MRNYLILAIKAALQAGDAIMDVYTTDFIVEMKEDDSPLTIADRNANRIINGYLKKTSIPIISEENVQIEFSERKNWTNCWIVDPLDGTKEFIKRNGEFTVNIALVENGVPLLGVIYVPVSKTLYFTSEDGSTSFKIKVEKIDTSIEEIFEKAYEIKAASKIENSVIVVGSRSHLNEETKAFISELEREHKVEIISKGSSLKFCMVAEGEAHLYPRYAPTMEWDTAAGQAICEAAGARVIDYTTGKPLLYNKENLLNPYFLVKR